MYGNRGPCVNGTFNGAYLLQEWRRHLRGLDIDRFLLWLVCPPVARALASGRLAADLSILWQRSGSLALGVHLS